MRNYSLLVPPGFRLVDLERDLTDACAEMAAAIVVGLGTEVRGKAKELVRRTLSESCAAMAREGSFAALVSIAPLVEQAMRPTMVLSRFKPNGGVDPLDAIVAMVSVEEGATLIENGDLVGVRVSRTDDVSLSGDEFANRLPQSLLDLAVHDPEGRKRAVATASSRKARRVMYFMGAPADDDSWVRVQAVVQVAGDAAGDALGDALVELFDAVTKTFRWQVAGE